VPGIKRKFTTTQPRPPPSSPTPSSASIIIGAIQNKSQYLAGLKDLSFKPEEIANSETSVYLYGDVAIVTSVYRTKGTDGGKLFIHHGRFTDTWIRRNGEWKCVADQETLIH